jgi:hypothetical protein
MNEPDYGLPPEPRAELRAYLAERGADPDRIAEADESRTLGPLAVELAVGLGRSTGKEDPVAVLTNLGAELLGMDVTLTITRLIDTATAQLADALVDAFRMQVEVPGLTAGTPYPCDHRRSSRHQRRASGRTGPPAASGLLTRTGRVGPSQP